MEPPPFLLHPLDALAQIDPQIEEYVGSLPRITEDELRKISDPEEHCAICMTTFQACIAEEELAGAMESPAAVVENLGVTRLHKSCGHIFCRKDITTWLRTAHTTCPTCRAPILPRSASPTTESTRDMLRDALQQLRDSDALNDAGILQGFPRADGLTAAGEDTDFAFIHALGASPPNDAQAQSLADLLGEIVAARQPADTAPARRDEVFNSMYA